MNPDLAAKIAQLEALRVTLGDVAVDAAIAALRAQTAPLSPSNQIGMDVGDDASVVDSPQTIVGGDMQGNALGSGNLVLHNIRIAAGGILQVTGLPRDLPPNPDALRAALATYLRTLIERYQFLNMQGLGATSRQTRIALDAVFVDLITDVTVDEGKAYLGLTDRIPPYSRAYAKPTNLTPELQQWINELFTDQERFIIFNPPIPPSYYDPDWETTMQGGTLSNYEEDLFPLLKRLRVPRTALELIRHYKALVLLGDPGSGKTTVLRHLALGFAFARLAADQPEASVSAELAWTGPLPLPILVQLRRFAADLDAPPQEAGPLLEHIERTLSGDRLQPLVQHLVGRLEAGEVVLLLDGLDEVADEQRRAWVSRAIALFHSRFPHSRLVVTSRIYAYREPCLLPPPFQTATLQPLMKQARDSFVGRWYRAALLQGGELAESEREMTAQQRAQELIAALERRPRLQEIAANPLLLTMIALLQQHRLHLPQQRAELYHECLTLLLEQWEQRRADDGGGGLAAELGLPDQIDRLALVQPIAYELQLRGTEEATNREVCNWLLGRFLDHAHGDGHKAKALITQFLTFLEGRSGLLIARDIKSRYAFPHKTFQEYLAARELIYQGNQVATDAVLRQRHAATWREVILLVAGHYVASGQPQAAKALGWALLEQDAPATPAFYRSAVLAGEIIEELGANLGRDGQKLREEVGQALVALVEGGHLSAKERVEAAFLLDRRGINRLPQPHEPPYWCDVAAGPFWAIIVANDDVASDDEQGEELEQVVLPYSYKIARYPVTNAEFARFIDDGGYKERRWWTKEGWAFLQPGGHPLDDQEQWVTLPCWWHDEAWNSASQPVLAISWYEAAAYCSWLTVQGHTQSWLPEGDEIRLPTWREWERAARHIDQRRYPWGDEPPTSEHTNYEETKIGRTSPVGCFTRGAAQCGALDLAGNVWEWTATLWQEAAAVVPRKDFTQVERAMLAGGEYLSKVEQIRCSAHGRFYPGYRDYYRGFRIVWSPRSSK